MAGEQVDQREIDRRSGFYAGALWAVSLVDGSDKEIERALTRMTGE